MSYHALDTQPIGTDMMMDAARMWAPINPTPMTFEPGFVLERALTPQPVPLHVQWFMADASRAWHDLVAFVIIAIPGLVILCAVLAIVSGWRGWQVEELQAEVNDLTVGQSLLDDAWDGLNRIRDALVQRQPAEALYQCERAMEGLR